MQTTANYGLKKPEGNDTVDIDVINGNMDTIDTKLKNNEDSIGNLQGTVNSHLADTAKHIGYAVTTNSGNAYSAAIPNLTALTDGLQIRLRFNVTATGAITLNINNLGAKNVYDYYGNKVSDIHGGFIANLAYNAVDENFILQGKGGGGNATSADLLSGKTATVDGGQIVGSMPNNPWGLVSNQSLVWNDSGNIKLAIKMPVGAYLEAKDSNNPTLSEVDVIENNLVSGNIKAGTNIFGVSGKSSVVDTADATALTADKILSGYSAYANGSKINGSATLQSLGGKRVYTSSSATNQYGHIIVSGLPFRPTLALITFTNGYVLILSNTIIVPTTYSLCGVKDSTFSGSDIPVMTNDGFMVDQYPFFGGNQTFYCIAYE